MTVNEFPSLAINIAAGDLAGVVKIITASVGSSRPTIGNQTNYEI